MKFICLFLLCFNVFAQITIGGTQDVTNKNQSEAHAAMLKTVAQLAEKEIKILKHFEKNWKKCFKSDIKFTSLLHLNFVVQLKLKDGIGLENNDQCGFKSQKKCLLRKKLKRELRNFMSEKFIFNFLEAKHPSLKPKEVAELKEQLMQLANEESE